MAESLATQTEAVRRFNRFYTQRIGVLHEAHLESDFSLAEVRLLFELAHRDGPTASELARDLSLDAGYVSRILRRFEDDGLLERRRSDADGRQNHLTLTNKGRRTFEPLNSRSDDEVSKLLGRLPAPDRDTLVTAMETVQHLLTERETPSTPYILRPPHAGDLGWVVHRHGVLYAREYGWDERFEGLVAEVVATFVATFDPKRERCWIAERDGRIVGSVFLVKKSDDVAKLRLLLVEPEARGLGIGHRLVAECTRFARQVGYRSIVLWTNSCLHAARKIYVAEGYTLVEEAAHDLFGETTIGQTWELKL